MVSSTRLIYGRLVRQILTKVLKPKKKISKPLVSTKSVDKEILTDASKVLWGLNNDFRLKLIRLIHLYQEITVKEMYTILCKQQSEVSNQLAILRSLQIVNSQKVNNRILYSLNYERLSQINKITAVITLDYKAN
jgi:DNA-binding transcriptional ArsR family regulator